MARGRPPTSARDAERVGLGRYEGQDFGPADALLDGQAIARQRLALDDVAQVVGEVLERREAAGFGVEVREVEAPAELLFDASAGKPSSNVQPTEATSWQGAV